MLLGFRVLYLMVELFKVSLSISFVTLRLINLYRRSSASCIDKIAAFSCSHSLSVSRGVVFLNHCLVASTSRELSMSIISSFLSHVTTL